ncbi:lysozyme inhibitor LprI family protein [Nissabacter sp. SGAir0207]|uniref:lysozyme inhibitor LprI family protein n=1 Tax=Nissabacter sp. SGAir0207 TaxID=2126321 RepID=UPI0010CD6AF9|nr:lysozyme inhibitor LprI family protein [Nissabacter sp. SGAir0207]QCR36967.1 hypothetical protein C1N62_13150 [Nissabacter sp. SGAir0207]
MKGLSRPVLLALLTLLPAFLQAAPTLGTGWNWADGQDGSGQGATYAQSRALCNRLRDRQPPAQDWPDAATAARLTGCDAEALYYGIMTPADPVQARQCALLEAQRGENQAFHGISLLMEIYANGRGAARDLDLATALACTLEGAPAENDDRPRTLQMLAAKKWQGDSFSFCDNITSGYNMGICTAHEARISEGKRHAQTVALIAHWRAADRQALQPLQQALQEYANASADHEVDLSGTARAAFQVEQRQHLLQQFDQLLHALEHQSLPVASARHYRAADAELNRVYRLVMAIAPTPGEGADHLPSMTVTKSGIRDTQRRWLRYRDAWLAFAAQKYPAVKPESLLTLLTRQRSKELRAFLPHE